MEGRDREEETSTNRVFMLGVRKKRTYFGEEAEGKIVELLLLLCSVSPLPSDSSPYEYLGTVCACKLKPGLCADKARTFTCPIQRVFKMLPVGWIRAENRPPLRSQSILQARRGCAAAVPRSVGRDTTTSWERKLCSANC